jgi:hypothetical protein
VLDEVAILVHQDLLDDVGMAEQHSPDGAEVAVGASPVGAEFEGVAPVLIEVAGESGAGGAAEPVDRRRHGRSPRVNVVQVGGSVITWNGPGGDF